MIAIAKKDPKRFRQAHWHNRFLDMLPTIRRYACRAFRNLPRSLRDERVDDVVASTFVAYRRLVDQSKEDLGYPTVLARYGVAQVSDGHSVGARANSRDVLSWCAQQRKGFCVQRLEEFDSKSGDGREVVVEDRRTCPADIAALRIDFAAWLRSLTHGERRIATKLATGETTNSVAKLFRLSAARISQLRRELYEAWQRFQGEECHDVRLAAAV